MNKKQEQALFGNILPERTKTYSEWWTASNCIGIDPTAHWDLQKEGRKNLLSLARSQREAIGALIQNVIDWRNKALSCSKRYLPGEDEKIILSAVIQDSWEDVRKTWCENE